jgi:hypothetical protein
MLSRRDQRPPWQRARDWTDAREIPVYAHIRGLWLLARALRVQAEDRATHSDPDGRRRRRGGRARTCVHGQTAGRDVGESGGDANAPADRNPVLAAAEVGDMDTHLAELAEHDPPGDRDVLDVWARMLATGPSQGGR